MELFGGMWMICGCGCLGPGAVRAGERGGSRGGRRRCPPSP